jgi:hypothetical protein
MPRPLAIAASAFCLDCDLREPWEMYYNVTETKERNPKFSIGAHATVMVFQGQHINVKESVVDFNEFHACKSYCKKDNDNNDQLTSYFMKLKGWCTSALLRFI